MQYFLQLLFEDKNKNLNKKFIDDFLYVPGVCPRWMVVGSQAQNNDMPSTTTVENSLSADHLEYGTHQGWDQIRSCICNLHICIRLFEEANICMPIVHLNEHQYSPSIFG